MTPPTLRRLAAATACLVIVLTGMSIAAPPEHSRQQVTAKDLELLEELLREAIQNSISQRIQRNRQLGPASVNGVDKNLPDSRWVLRVGGHSGAHGVFIEGHGAIFAVQMPTMAMVPRVMLADPRRQSLLVGGRVVEADPDPRAPTARRRPAPINRPMLEFRARHLGQQLVEMRRAVERLFPDDESAAIERMQQQMNDLSNQLLELRVGSKPEGSARTVAPDKVASDGEADPTPASDDSPTLTPARTGGAYLDRYADYHEAWSSLRQGGFRGEMRARRREIVDTVTDAVVETLARYGGLLHGLRSQDNISVVLLPAAVRSPIQGHSGNAIEEFVLSVKVEDIQTLGREEIDHAEFRRRVNVHSRIGTRLDSGDGAQDDPENGGDR